MSKWAWFCVLAVSLVACGKSSPPAVELSDGNMLTANSWHGEYIFVNYWAEWCEPCREEIPELNKLVQGFPPEKVLGINFDQPEPVELSQQISRMGIAFPVVMSGAPSWLVHERPSSLPATYIFNTKGELVKQVMGPQTAATLLYLKQQHVAQSGGN